MSRIESALEKAAMLRSGESLPRTVPAPVPPPLQREVRHEPAVRLEVTNPLLVCATEPHTFVAEEYRKLKSILVSITRDKSFRNNLMVTSSLSSEGKTVTSLNLAITLAQEHDHTVLLIDADLRRPAIHRYLGIEPTCGLSDCMMDGLDIGAALIHTGIGRLSVLPAGKVVKNPAELFSSQRGREIFREIKHRYPDRYVIIDTPPVLPFSESRTLSTLVDGVVFVVKEGVASVDEITESMGYLQSPSLLGIVYNEASIGNQAGRYHYY